MTENFLINIYHTDDLPGLRRAGQLAARCLDYIETYIEPGVSTETLNQLCHAFILDHHATPAPLNYRGFPKSICTSVNHVVCHGIPSNEHILRQGDIINVDVTVILDGWYGDTSRMFGVGEKIPIKAKRLCMATWSSLQQAIDVVRPSKTLGDIGHAIQQCVEPQGMAVVRDFVGHGIGRQFHEPPHVFHFGQPNQGMSLRAGMVFTIEPMINLGGYACKILSDGWTVVTRDKSLSAQYEHMMMVTEDGVEVLTYSQTGDGLQDKLRC